MSNKRRPIADFYLKYPLQIDVTVAAFVWLLDTYVQLIVFKFADKATVLNLISSIISTCISLAGFILAALTIIVTFRSNLKAKDMALAANAMELIISSNYYNQIVSVYIGAIYEFLVVSFALYIFWLSIDNFNSQVIWTKTVLGGVILTGAAVFRSLFVLFSILKLEKYDKNDSQA